MKPSAETEIDSVSAASTAVVTEPITVFQRGRLLFGQLLSPETAVHQTALSVADQGVASAANFFTGIIIARACSKTELGLYSLGFSLVALLLNLQTSLITTPYMVYAPRLEARARALYTGSTLIHQLVLCLVTMLGVMCGAFAVAHGLGPRGLAPVLWALVLVIGLILLREYARSICFARLKLKTAFALDAFISVGQIGALLVLARLRLLSASRAYWVVGGVCGIAVVAWLWFDSGAYEISISESLADLKKNWVLGKWVFASGLIWAVAMNIYPWLLAGFHGVTSTAIWAACLGVVSIGNPALLGIQNLIGPKVSHVYAERGHHALRRLVLKVAAWIALPVSLLCVGMFIWGGRLLVLLYGRRYAGYGEIVAILSLNLLVTAVGFGFSRALFAVDRARVDFLVNFTALFVMVTLGLWLIREFGPLGAAFGLLGANFAASSVRSAVFLKQPVGIPRAQEIQ